MKKLLLSFFLLTWVSPAFAYADEGYRMLRHTYVCNSVGADYFFTRNRDKPPEEYLSPLNRLRVQVEVVNCKLLGLQETVESTNVRVFSQEPENNNKNEGKDVNKNEYEHYFMIFTPIPEADKA